MWLLSIFTPIWTKWQCFSLSRVLGLLNAGTLSLSLSCGFHELWLGNRKHPTVLACSWLCGEQEAPHRSCSIVPAGQEESLHLLQFSVPPSPPFVLGQPWLRASLQVRTTKCSLAHHCSTSLMSLIDSSSTPASIFPQGIDQKKSQPRSKDEINGSQDSWNSAAMGSFKVTWY